MTAILIRDIDQVLHAALKRRAAEHHRSLEAEARVILAAALAGERALRWESFPTVHSGIVQPVSRDDINAAYDD